MSAHDHMSILLCCKVGASFATSPSHCFFRAPPMAPLASLLRHAWPHFRQRDHMRAPAR
jgi:hypothetical protein